MKKTALLITLLMCVMLLVCCARQSVLTSGENGETDINSVSDNAETDISSTQDAPDGTLTDIDASSDDAALIDEPPVSVGGDQQEICDSLSESYSALCVQAAVIKNGRVDSVYSYGTAERSTGREVNEDTKYRVASITKLVSVMVFFCLKQEGLVDENADISVYFDYPCHSPYYPDTVITPLMIMSHTASMVDVGPMYLSDGTLSSKSFYIGYEPGTFYAYSNSGFAVIQCICERVTGMEFDAIAKQYIFEPLGIDAAYIASGLKDTSNLGELRELTISTMLSRKPRPLGTGLNFAQGNLYCSAKDYAKILCLLMNDGLTADGTRILSTESINTMKTVRISNDSFGVALGMRKQTNVFQNKTVYTHTGSSYGLYSAYLFSPEEKSGVVVITSGCPPEKDETTQIYRACLNYITALYPEN
ncbi:MAG: beta-lactamase family protein [Oscillospiraceae bacterium]|nr:beta-lactamase family protein [Oscillospiraceae bacterium]